MRTHRLSTLCSLVLYSLVFAQVCNTPARAAVTIQCDGSADDVEINAALAAGGEVLLSGGCFINNALIIPNAGGGISNVTLRGGGFYATIINPAPSFTGSAMIVVNGTTTITDLQLDGFNRQVWGIKNQTTAGNVPSILKNIAFLRLGLGGYYNAEGATGAVYNISDCFFLGADVAINNADWGANSIISRNNVLGGQGFVFTNQGNTNSGIVIDGNVVISLDSGGIGTMTFYHCLNCILSNNVFDDISSSNPPPSLTIANGTLYKVTNNWFGQGANVYGGSEFYFSGNTFPGAAQMIFNTVSNVQFANNHLQYVNCSLHCNPPDPQSLFLLGCTNVQVHHNNFQGQIGSIYANGNNHLLVRSNVFSGTCARDGNDLFIFNTGGTNCHNAPTYISTSW